MYVVYISDNALKRKRIVAGFFVKTSCTHLDFDFVERLTAIVSCDIRLRSQIDDRSIFLPSRIGIPGKTRPTFEEMVQIVIAQALKRGVGTTA